MAQPSKMELFCSTCSGFSFPSKQKQMPREVQNLLLTPWEVIEYETGSIPLCTWEVMVTGKLLLLLVSSYISTNPPRGGERCPRKATGMWNLCVRHALRHTGADQPRLWEQGQVSVTPNHLSKNKNQKERFLQGHLQARVRQLSQ